MTNRRLAKSKLMANKAFFDTNYPDETNYLPNFS